MHRTRCDPTILDASLEVVGTKSLHPLHHVFDVLSLKLVEVPVVGIVSNICQAHNSLLDELVIDIRLREISI